MLDFLSRRPREKLQNLLTFSLPLLIIATLIVMYLLKLSNYPGTLDKTQLGFSGEYIKSGFSRMSNEASVMALWVWPRFLLAKFSMETN